MKKIVLLFLACILTVFTVICPYAEEAFPSANELEKLVDNALLVRSILGAGRYPWDYESGELSSIVVKEERNGILFSYIYRPVIDGFDEAGIKKLVNDTLSEEFAGDVLARNGAFFEDFKEIDGAMYFREWGYTLCNGYREYKRDSAADIVVVEKSTENAVIEVHLIPDLTVRLSLVNENGTWKVSSYDADKLLLTGNPELMKADDFSEEAALEAVKAVIMEGYYYTSLNGHATDAFYELGGGSKLLEGSLAQPETWRQYLKGFASDGIADKVLFKNDMLKLRSDGLLERTINGCGTDIYQAVQGFAANRLTVTSADASNATCIYSFGYGDKEICSLTIEFTRSGGRWLISGGDFYEKIQSVYSAHANPQTSDSGIFAITVAAALAVAILIKRKRHGAQTL
ncbi:MAG: hypothetical protein J5921_04415 [Clostridia bacterium]|nr:hypothetical protein [Clostridia bacterium]